MKSIGIFAGSISAGQRTLFEALGQAFGVRFEHRCSGDIRGLAARVVIGADREITNELIEADLPSYVVVSDKELRFNGCSSQITCATSRVVEPVLRGRVINDDDVPDLKVLPTWLVNAVPVASKSDAPVWAVQEVGKHQQHHFVAMPVPCLDDREPLFTQFSGDRFVGLLPLVTFVAGVANDVGWEPPPLQAAFMFDDPNLHWPSYGFIKYRELVERAEANHYHVSIATIPLDGWYVHPTAAKLFKDNARQISLLCHGNDHVKRELTRLRYPGDATRLITQALGRLARMEYRSGISVARVMAPPHGACNEVAIDAMCRYGFEAICVSRGSLRYHNEGAGWIRTLGMSPCDLVSRLPVIPRFGLSANCENDILIAALLRQPIVPITHHQALAKGYEQLEAAASIINSFPNVLWQDLATISRSLYAHRRDGQVLQVRMYSRRISILVPEGVASIYFEVRPDQNSEDRVLYYRIRGVTSEWNVASPSRQIAVEPFSTVEIVSGDPSCLSQQREPGRTRLGPILRRALTESRDRTLPHVTRFTELLSAGGKRRLNMSTTRTSAA